MKKSRMSDYAIGIVLHMKNYEQYSINQIAQKLSMSIYTVGKILKILKKADVLKSTLGKNGGYCLNKKKENISILDIIWAIDGKQSWAKCVGGKCIIKHTCDWKQSIINVQEIEEKIFSLITLNLVDDSQKLLHYIKEKL